MRASKLLPYGLLALAGVVFFGPVLAGSKFLWSDFLNQYYPYHYFLFEHLRRLAIPVWNPYIFSGMPFVGDVQSQVFYPVNWLLAFFSSPAQGQVFRLVELKVVLHFIAGGIFTYRLLKDFELAENAALLGGLTFMLSGYLVAHTNHVTIICALAWLPLLLQFFPRLLKTRHVRAAAAAGLVLGMMNLAGHPQVTLHVLYALFLLLAWHVISNWGQERANVIRYGGLFALVLVIGFGLAAVAWLPAWEHSRLTVREDLSFAASADGSAPPLLPLLLIVPKLLGSYAQDGSERFWASSNPFHYWENVAYLGILPLVFALFGWLKAKHRLRHAFGVIAVLSLIAALGRYTPLYWLVYKLLPGFDRFRIPGRLLDLFTLSMVILAGLGMDAFLKLEPNDRRAGKFLRGLTVALGVVVLGWLASLAGLFRSLHPALSQPGVAARVSGQIGLAVLFLAAAVFLFRMRRGKRPPKWIPAAALLLTVIDLFLFGFRFPQGTQSPDKYFPASPTVRWLQAEQQKERLRISARRDNAALLQPNEGMLHHLELVEGFTPLGIADYAGFHVPPATRRDLLNVRHYLDTVPGKPGAATFFANPTALPRASLFFDYRVLPHAEILGLLSRDDFDHHRTLLLEQEPKWTARAAGDSTARVEIVSYAPDRIVLKTSTGRHGLLLLSEVYYPKWKARIDGTPREVLRADYCLRALPVEAGTHEVVFYYDTGSLKLGGAISLIALVLGVGLAVVLRRKGSEVTRRT